MRNHPILNFFLDIYWLTVMFVVYYHEAGGKNIYMNIMKDDDGKLQVELYTIIEGLNCSTCYYAIGNITLIELEKQLIALTTKRMVEKV